MNHNDMVRCEVSMPADFVGDVMAELFRIGSAIQGMRHEESRTLIMVGIPYGSVILFEKWLAKAFCGDATSTLLPMGGNSAIESPSNGNSGA